MSERFKGNFEIIDTLTGNGRTSVGRAIDPAQAEMVLMALEGLSDLETVDPKPVGASDTSPGTTPVGQWTATDGEGRPVVVKLWRDVTIDETAFGQALRAALGPQEG